MFSDMIYTRTQKLTLRPAVSKHGKQWFKVTMHHRSVLSYIEQKLRNHLQMAVSLLISPSCMIHELSCVLSLALKKCVVILFACFWRHMVLQQWSKRQVRRNTNLWTKLNVVTYIAYMFCLLVSDCPVDCVIWLCFNKVYIRPLIKLLVAWAKELIGQQGIWMEFKVTRNKLRSLPAITKLELYIVPEAWQDLGGIVLTQVAVVFCERTLGRISFVNLAYKIIKLISSAINGCWNNQQEWSKS